MNIEHLMQYVENDKERPYHQTILIDHHKHVIMVTIVDGEECGNPGVPTLTADLWNTEYRGVNPDAFEVKDVLAQESWYFGDARESENYDALIGFLRAARESFEAIVANTGTGVMLDLVDPGLKLENGQAAEVIESGFDEKRRYVPS